MRKYLQRAVAVAVGVLCAGAALAQQPFIYPTKVQSQQQQASMQAQGMSNYQRAFKACMNGRGYNVD